VSSVFWDPGLESILVCPDDLGPLVWRAEEGLAYNPRSGRGYHVERGVARLLVSESFNVDLENLRH
jgi:uncharacterized protein YbaR (Trm112 family)